MRAGLIDARERTRLPSRIEAGDVAALHESLDPYAAAFETARLLMGTTAAHACGVWFVDEDEVTAAIGAVAAGERISVVDDFAGRSAALGWPLAEAVAGASPLIVDCDLDLTPEASGAPVLLVPLGRRGKVAAVAALAPVAETIGVHEVAAHAGAALSNALKFARQAAALARLERQVERLDVLHDLGGALAERGGSKALVDRLNRLLGGRGLEVESLAWKSRAVARRLGGADLTSRERTMLKNSEPVTALSDGRLAVAMRVGRKHVGAMRVRGTSDAADVPFLELLAAGVAEVANRISLRAEVEEAARGTALAHERDRIAGDLHDTAGQLFVAIQLLARREAEKLQAGSEAATRFRRLADLAEQGKWEIDHAIDALAFFPAARHGLVPAVRSLASSFQSDSELDVIVDVFGRPVRLSPRAERALYRVVHESLANAWRHARCSVVRIALSFERQHVHLTVTDDGTGLTETIPDRGRVGTSNMRRAVNEVGGTFHIRNARPRGVVVEAEIPRDGR